MKSLGLIETANIVRSELAKNFPGTKFSVTTQRYSMGCSIRVRYTDGPPSDAVNAAIGWISGKSFDGMDDSTHYHATEYNGEKVQFATYGPSVNRDITALEERKLLLTHLLCERIDYKDWQGYEPWSRDVWAILGSWDARWETMERAVERFMAERCK